MPKYLVQASYTVEGLRGLMKEGGSSRRTAVEKLVKGLGGRVEAFYYGFGETDAFVIAEVPDNVSAAAVALTVNASGMVHIKTTPLLTTEEVDEAVKRRADYRAPGA
jgi:uncharacterized protein with GYD domain